jgi:hypothetical protein
MFRVVGRDAQGRTRELSVCAATEEEARATVNGLGVLVAIDHVSIPPLVPTSRFPKVSRPVATALGLLLCLGCVVAGTVLGWWIGRVLDESSPGQLIHMRWLFGSAVGAILGAIVGVSLLISFLWRSWGSGESYPP